MWFAVYPFFKRVTLVESQTNIVPRPSFLFHHLPDQQSGNTSQSSQPRRRNQPSSSSAAAGRADGAAGSATRSAAAGRADGAAGSATRSTAAGRADGAAGSVTTAAAGHAAGAADASSSAHAAAGASSGVNHGGNSGTGSRRRHGVARSQLPPLFLIHLGQKYHCDVDCYGLRNARTVQESIRCSQCGPVQSRPVIPLYGIGQGSYLHESLPHLQCHRAVRSRSMNRVPFACSMKNDQFDLTATFRKGLSFSRCCQI